MNQALARASAPFRNPAAEMLRIAIVCGCALALICAERALPLF